MQKLFTLSLLLVSLSISASKPTTIFLDNDHCVAWKARKVMALVKTVEPVGKNCNITTEIRKDESGDFFFYGEFPIKSFDSKEPDRDEEVRNILLADKNPNITFKSDSFKKEDWKKLLEKTDFTLSGTLKVAGRARAFDIPLSFSAKKIKGVLKTKYTAFRLTPPSVGGGLIAKAKDYLELHFQFQVEKIRNREKVVSKEL